MFEKIKQKIVNIDRNVKWRYFLYFIVFVLPILALMNCEGNEGSGIHSCYIFNCESMRWYAEAYFMFVLLSAFTAGIPIIFYIWFSYIIIGFLTKHTDMKIWRSFLVIATVFFVLLFLVSLVFSSIATLIT